MPAGMSRKRTIALSAVVALVFAVGAVSMWQRQAGRVDGPATAQRQVQAQMMTDNALEAAVRAAQLPIDKLVVRNVGGIVVVRGDAPDHATVQKAGETIRALGFQRVANLVQVPAAPDDDAIRREAERQLARTPALHGCRFVVAAENGVLKVSATIQRELQADAARSILRTIDGARRVELEVIR